MNFQIEECTLHTRTTSELGDVEVLCITHRERVAVITLRESLLCASSGDVTRLLSERADEHVRRWSFVDEGAGI